MSGRKLAVVRQRETPHGRRGAFFGQMAKDEPQPQDEVALGFDTLK